MLADFPLSQHSLLILNSAKPKRICKTWESILKIDCPNVYFHIKILASARVHTCRKISLVPRPDPVCWSPWEETTKMAAGEQIESGTRQGKDY